MHRTLARTLAALALVVAAPALAQQEDLIKPLKVVIGSVRYGKDAAALKQFAGEQQGRMLLEGEWDKATVEQRREFLQLFHTLFAKLAFPNIRENFKHLGAVNYEAPKIEGARATVASTLVIDHPLKKQELKVRYLMTQEGGAWKVVDVSVLGDSMLGGIRDEQIRPLIAEGGFALLLDRMRAKAAEPEPKSKRK